MTTPSHMRPGMPERGSYDDLFKDMERRIRALEVAARLPLSAIGEGGITVLDGGQIVFLEADGSELMVLDSARMRFNRSNGTRILEITPAGGLKIYAANGTTEQVVLDDDGLWVDGVLQPALANLTGSDSSNASTTTSLTTVNEVEIVPPSWANEVTLYSQARLQVSNNSGANQSMTNRLANAVGDAQEEVTDDNWSIPTGNTLSSFVALTTTLTTPPSPIVIRQASQTTSGTHTSESRLEVLAICRRV